MESRKIQISSLKCIKIDSSNIRTVMLLYKDSFPALKHIRVSPDIITKLYINLKSNLPLGLFSVDQRREMILAIAVNNLYRNKGIGKQLLKEAIKNKGYNLTVRKTNLIAIKMYKKYGFKTCDENNYPYIMKRPNKNNRGDFI